MQLACEADQISDVSADMAQASPIDPSQSVYDPLTEILVSLQVSGHPESNEGC